VLGVQFSNQAALFVCACPVGPYYRSGFQPVKLLADDQNVRAWPGGVGSYKIGGYLIIFCFIFSSEFLIHFILYNF
jgi:branched-subunit amino acid aminotransferase/4-amino-4-deoxychorismate lyase